jgi:hypothetical protein
LPHTQFTYWLEEQIKWVLREGWGLGCGRIRSID